MVNPPDAQRCDCGHSFADGTIGPALERKVSEGERRDRVRARKLGRVFAGSGLALIVHGVWITAGQDYEFRRSDLPAMIVVAALALCLVVAGGVLMFRRR